MLSHEIDLPPHHKAVVDRFITACQSDDRIMAAFLGGSYAKSSQDMYSDLDLFLITTDNDFDDFYAQREDFVRLLGDPVFIEDFDLPDIVFYVLSEGAEGELGIGRESHFDLLHSGPYLVLLDKKSILAGVVFPVPSSDLGRQREQLRRLVFWFWHDLSHFITAMGRGQLWWAYGQLEELRRYCIGLARLQNDFSDLNADQEVYFKIEQAIPGDRLAALQASFCSLDEGELLKSIYIIVQFYQELAVPLAKRHGVCYPKSLERIMVQRLENLPQNASR